MLWQVVGWQHANPASQQSRQASHPEQHGRASDSLGWEANTARVIATNSSRKRILLGLGWSMSESSLKANFSTEDGTGAPGRLTRFSAAPSSSSRALGPAGRFLLDRGRRRSCAPESPGKGHKGQQGPEGRRRPRPVTTSMREIPQERWGNSPILLAQPGMENAIFGGAGMASGRNRSIHLKEGS